MQSNETSQNAAGEYLWNLWEAGLLERCPKPAFCLAQDMSSEGHALLVKKLLKTGPTKINFAQKARGWIKSKII